MDQLPWIELEKLTAKALELATANDWEGLGQLAGALDAARMADAEWVARNLQSVGDKARLQGLQQASENLQAVAEHVLPAHKSMGKLLSVLAPPNSA